MTKPQDEIHVEIYDQEYHMRGDLDAEYIHKLAKYLDGKMRSIAARTHTVDSLRVAILAAMNIADEYYQLKSQFDATKKQVDEKVDELSEVLDEILRQAA